MPREETLQRERTALELRRAKASYAEIGAVLDVTAQGAWKMVQRALTRITTPAADALRQEEADMFDRLHRARWPAALSGDHQAVMEVLKISEQRCRLLGLNAPVQAQIDLIRPEKVAELTALLDEMLPYPPDTAA